MTPETIDRPEVRREVERLFDAYERALMANDVAALNGYFWRDARVTRYGIADLQLGHEALHVLLPLTGDPLGTGAELARGAVETAVFIEERASGWFGFPRPSGLLRRTLRLLDEQGFEPTVDPDDAVTLRNCPFDYLASEHTDLICGMNLCLLDAAVEGVGRTGLRARLEPGQDHCCVRLRPK